MLPQSLGRKPGRSDADLCRILRQGSVSVVLFLIDTENSLPSRLEASTSMIKRLRTISVDCARMLPRLNCPWESAVASLVRNELDPSTDSDVLLKSYLSLFIRRVISGATVQQIYIEFEMGCKMVADHADDTPRVAKLIVTIFISIPFISANICNSHTLGNCDGLYTKQHRS
jgi:hypothetical protein